MNIKIFLLFLVPLIVSCRGFEFAYDKSPTIKSLENNTYVTISGDDMDIIISQLNQVVGASTGGGEFALMVTSSKTSNNIVIKDNQTVSQIEIKHILNYNLKKGGEGCNIAKAKISTSSTYNLKSSGYSFGTDLAKIETAHDNIEKNINDFFQLLNNNHSNLGCLNED